MKALLLDHDQIFSKDALNVIQIFGRKVGASDLAILQGATVNSNGVRDASGNYTADAWTTSKRDIEPNRSVTGVNYYGDEFGMSPSTLHGLIRPVLQIEPKDHFINLKNVTEEKFFNGRSVNKLLVLELGRYPQTVVSQEESKKLEKLLLGNTRATGEHYTFNKHKIWKSEIPDFHPYNCQRFECDGQEYIRIFAQPANKSCILSDRRYAEYGEIYWVKVEPIRWLVEPESNLLISEKGLLSGIPFTTEKEYNGDFAKTLLCRYLNTYFIHEIIDTRKLCRFKGMSLLTPELGQHLRE